MYFDIMDGYNNKNKGYESFIPYDAFDLDVGKKKKKKEKKIKLKNGYDNIYDHLYDDDINTSKKKRMDDRLSDIPYFKDDFVTYFTGIDDEPEMNTDNVNEEYLRYIMNHQQNNGNMRRNDFVDNIMNTMNMNNTSSYDTFDPSYNNNKSQQNMNNTAHISQMDEITKLRDEVDTKITVLNNRINGVDIKLNNFEKKIEEVSKMIKDVDCKVEGLGDNVGKIADYMNTMVTSTTTGFVTMNNSITSMANAINNMNVTNTMNNQQPQHQSEPSQPINEYVNYESKSMKQEPEPEFDIKIPVPSMESNETQINDSVDDIDDDDIIDTFKSFSIDFNEDNSVDIINRNRTIEILDSNGDFVDKSFRQELIVDINNYNEPNNFNTNVFLGKLITAYMHDTKPVAIYNETEYTELMDKYHNPKCPNIMFIKTQLDESSNDCHYLAHIIDPIDLYNFKRNLNIFADDNVKMFDYAVKILDYMNQSFDEEVFEFILANTEMNNVGKELIGAIIDDYFDDNPDSLNENRPYQDYDAICNDIATVFEWMLVPEPEDDIDSLMDNDNAMSMLANMMNMSKSTMIPDEKTLGDLTNRMKEFEKIDYSGNIMDVLNDPNIANMINGVMSASMTPNLDGINNSNSSIDMSADDIETIIFDNDDEASAYIEANGVEVIK